MRRGRCTIPKKLKTHPNERVDIADFVRASNDYTQETVAFNALRGLLDKYARVLDGFRVDIPSQTANPGQVTIYNGNALDRTGQLLNNEDQANTSKTVTLSGASTTFYIEVEFVEADSDVDSRAFWDPTFDQTSPIPDGKEFQINVATRTSPDWQVVTPVSTTGFAVSTNPDSLRVPIAMLRTDASNEITGAVNPGLAQVFPSTVLELDEAIAATILHTVDSRLFVAGDTVTVDLGGAAPQTGAIISAIDHINGEITIAPGLAAAHLAGAIIRRTSGTGISVQERTIAIPDLSVTASPPAADVQARLWQGDETRGDALSTSKETFGSRDDLQVSGLKDYIDFSAAQRHEMKFGPARADVTSLSPPASFAATPRHYDPVGGIAGSRYATVSIGDGTGSYGDFNGTDQAPFIAAIAELSTRGGGVLLVKEGTYTFTAGVSIVDPVTIIGAGKEVTSVVSNVAAAPAFDLNLGAIDDNAKVVMENLTVSVGTGADEAITLETVTLVANQADFECEISLVGGAGIQSRILGTGCLFNPPATAFAAISGLTASTFDEELANSTFIQCTFFQSARPALQCALNNVAFWQCAFTSTVAFFANTGTRAWSDISLQNCQTLLGSGFLAAGGAVSRLSVENCSLSITGGVSGNLTRFVGAATNISFENTLFNTTWAGTGLGTQGRIIRFDTTVDQLDIRNCTFTSTTGQFVDHISFEGAGSALSGVTIDGCSFTAFQRGIRIIESDASAFTISSCTFDANLEAIQQEGILYEDGDSNVTVRDCVFERYGDASSTSRKIGIRVQATSPNRLKLRATHNLFSIGGDGVDVGDDSAGVSLQAAGAGGLEADVSHNHFETIANGRGDIYGIFVGGAAVDSDLRIISNLIGFMDFAAGTGNMSGIFLNQVNGGVISHNTIRALNAASNNVADITISNCEDLNVTNNILHTPFITGTPPTYEAAIYMDNSSQKVSICNNTIIGLSSVQGADHGIHVSVSGTMNDITVDGNQISMDVGMEVGIFLEGTSVLTGFSCSSNRVTNLSFAAAVTGGIQLTLPGSSEMIQVNNNTIRESVYDDEHFGIKVDGTDASEAVLVQVCNNVVKGLVSGAVDRAGSLLSMGLRVSEVDVYQINGNLIQWGSATIDATGIILSDADHGTVMSNCVDPGDPAGGHQDMNIDASNHGSIVGGNIVGSVDRGNGDWTNADTDTLSGAVDAPLEFTNKTV